LLGFVFHVDSRIDVTIRGRAPNTAQWATIDHFNLRCSSFSSMDSRLFESAVIAATGFRADQLEDALALVGEMLGGTGVRQSADQPPGTELLQLTPRA
jgi:hypothetical protein